jgi:hypothetical protein
MMSLAQSVSSASVASLSWRQICEEHPNEWVCLRDVENDARGLISAARVISHDRSIERALDLAEPAEADTTVVHTSGRPLWTPRTEILDESPNDVRSRR